MFIQTEVTPNPATLKFLPGRPVMDEGTFEARDEAQAERSPLAKALMQLPGVGGVFFANDFISVTKTDGEWQHLRPQVLGKDDRAAGTIVYMIRPRGYFGVGRDKILLDGSPPPGIAPGVPSVSAAKLALPTEPARSVVGRFNDEEIAALTWPLKDNHVSVIELTY